MRRVLFVLLALLSLAAVGACGDDDDGGGADDAGGGAAAEPDGDATVAIASTSLGDVLVDGSGRTLYLFTKDTAATSACTGGCSSAWPALTVKGEPTPGEGVDKAKLGTIGAGHVTYGGRLLYRYAQDVKAGDVTGHGVGGVWFAVDAEGEAVESSAPASDPTPSY